MEDWIRKARIGNEELRIVRDECEESPREWDNLGKIVCWHRRYQLPQEGPRKFDTPGDFSEYLKEIEYKVLILPIFMYDHSGVSISTSNQYPFDDYWDAGQIGYIYVTYETIRKEYGVKRISKKTLQKAKSVLMSEVETYDQFLRGDVYGFVLVQLQVCNQGAEHENHIDSCYGFYGDDVTKNGMLEYLDPKWKNAQWQN
jgi:hypothetical protein